MKLPEIPEAEKSYSESDSQENNQIWPKEEDRYKTTVTPPSYIAASNGNIAPKSEELIEALEKQSEVPSKVFVPNNVSKVFKENISSNFENVGLPVESVFKREEKKQEETPYNGEIQATSPKSPDLNSLSSSNRQK